MSGRYNAPQSVVDSWSTPYPTDKTKSDYYEKYWNHPKETDARAEGSQV